MTTDRTHMNPGIASIPRVRLAVCLPPSVVAYWADAHESRHLCRDPTSNSAGGVRFSALSGLVKGE
jgi:hypothetical protein